MLVPHIKFCGLSSTEDIDDAIETGAHYAGFIHHPASPRHVTLEDIDELSRYAYKKIKTVAVVVNPENATLEAFKKQSLTHIQLHGSESHERCENIKFITKKNIIKACSIKNIDDVQNALSYQSHVDMLLFDAKTDNADMPGGLGKTFDWSLLGNINVTLPWFLAGGLSLNNVDKALDMTGASMLDVSSSIESSAGVKDHQKMREFMNYIKQRTA